MGCNVDTFQDVKYKDVVKIYNQQNDFWPVWTKCLSILLPSYLAKKILIKRYKVCLRAGFVAHLLQCCNLACILLGSSKRPFCTYEDHHGLSIAQFLKHLSVGGTRLSVPARSLSSEGTMNCGFGSVHYCDPSEDKRASTLNVAFLQLFKVWEF